MQAVISRAWKAAAKPGLALVLGLGLALDAQAGVDPKVQQVVDLQKAGKSVKLGAIDGWNHVVAWSNVALKAIDVAENGQGFTSSARIMGRDTRLCMFRTSDEIDGWALVFQPVAFHFGQLGPAFEKSPIAHLRFSKQVFTFATHGAELENKDVPEQAKAFYESILGSGFDLDLKAGVNMHSRLDGHHSGMLTKIFEDLRIQDPDTVLQGSLGSAIGEYLLETEVTGFDAGDAKESLVQFDLQALFPAISPGFFPPWLRSSQLGLFFHGQLGSMDFGFRTLLGTTIEGKDLDFETMLEFNLEAGEVEDGAAPSGPELTASVSGHLVEDWEDVGGLEWLDFNDVTIKGTVGSKVALVLHAGANLGGKDLDVTAGLIAPAEGGMMPLPLLRAKVDELELDDLIAITNEIGEALDAPGRIGSADLPHIRLEEVELGFVPPGGKDKDLNTGDEGVHIAGTLFVEGSEWTQVDGSMGKDGLTLNGHMREFHLGALTLEKAQVLMDAQFPSIKDPHLPALGIEGGFDLLGDRQHAKVFVTVGGYELELDTKVWELWDAHLRLYASAFSNPDFQVDAVLENHFAEKLASLGGGNAKKLAEEAANQVDEAGKQVADALKSVHVKDEEIERAKKDIEAARKKANRAISDAQKKVDSWYSGYKSRKNACNKRCKHKTKICWINWKFEKKCKTKRWSTPCPDVARCAEKAYYWTGYNTAKGVLEGVKRANDAVLRGTSAAAHPTVKALEHAANQLGDAVDAARSQKQHLENTLRTTLEVAAFIGKGLGGVLDIEHAQFQMGLKDLIQGKAANMAIRGKFAGKGFEASLEWDGKDVEGLAKRLVERLIAGHGKSGNHKASKPGARPGKGSGVVTNPWTSLGGGVVDVGFDPKGGLWVTNRNKAIYKRVGDSWKKQVGGLNRIAVGPDGPWGIGDANTIYRWNGSSWNQIPGRATDIGVGANGDAWVIGGDGSSIWHWVEHGQKVIRRKQPVMVQPRGFPPVPRMSFKYVEVKVPAEPSWVRVSGAAKRIAVDGKGRAWVVNESGGIYRRKGQGWEQLPGKAYDVGAGPDGTVWVVGRTQGSRPGAYRLYRWNEASHGWDPSKGLGKAIAADSKGRAFTVGWDDAVWHGPS